MRVMDLFRRWDVDDSGEVDPDEFHEALRALGYDGPQEETDALFADLDEDDSGAISYRELQRALALQAAARG